jgi:hypothetical protein
MEHILPKSRALKVAAAAREGNTAPARSTKHGHQARTDRPRLRKLGSIATESVGPCPRRPWKEQPCGDATTCWYPSVDFLPMATMEGNSHAATPSTLRCHFMCAKKYWSPSFFFFERYWSPSLGLDCLRDLYTGCHVPVPLLQFRWAIAHGLDSRDER